MISGKYCPVLFQILVEEKYGNVLECIKRVILMKRKVGPYLRSIVDHCVLDEAFTIVFEADSKNFNYCTLIESGPKTNDIQS